MSFESPGSSKPPFSIFAEAIAEQQTHGEIHARNINMVPLMLEPTSEPVWHEDEERESRAGKEADKARLKVATGSIADQMGKGIRLSLPDRIFGCLLKLPKNDMFPVDGFEYFTLYVPTIFAADSGITPRRLLLDLTLDNAKDSGSARKPIGCYLYPRSNVITRVTNIGEFKIDLGEAAVKAIKTVWPAMPEILTARTGGSIDIKKVQARIQSTGVNTHELQWRIADREISYDFNPTCVVQVPDEAQLAVSASLSVEVRKKIARIIYKKYFRSAKPMRYVLSRADGEAVEPGKLQEGSEVTLRQPGVMYANERTRFSYTFGSYELGGHEPESAMPSPELNNLISDAAAEAESFPGLYRALNTAIAENSLSLRTEALVLGYDGRQPSLAPADDFPWPDPIYTRVHALSGVLPPSICVRAPLRVEGTEVRPPEHADLQSLPWLTPAFAEAICPPLRIDLDPLVIISGGVIIGIIQWREVTESLYRHARIDIYCPSFSTKGAPGFLGLGEAPDYPEECTGAANAISLVTKELLGNKEAGRYHRVTCEPALANEAAIHSFDIAGFRTVGVMRQYRRGKDGQFHDTVLMERLLEETYPPGARAPFFDLS
jgi:aminoglycoside 6'-N-acetyltransferase